MPASGPDVIRPPGVEFDRAEAFVPIFINPDSMTGRASNYLRVIARLRPNATVDQAQRELEALQLIKGLRHHNLLSLQAFFSLEDRLVIVLELADESLRSRLEACRRAGLPGIPPAELARYFGEAAEALDYLHEHQVHHRAVAGHAPRLARPRAEGLAR